LARSSLLAALLLLSVVFHWSSRAKTVTGEGVCEHSFVTSQGSPYGRFRKALDRGNVTEALSAASELRHVGLLEALELCLLLREKAPEKYSRAAVRWHSRFARELPAVTIEDSQAVLAALGAIAGEHGQSAARALAEVLNGLSFEQARDVLMRWARTGEAAGASDMTGLTQR
jgi:hypothetical protein